MKFNRHLLAIIFGLILVILVTDVEAQRRRSYSRRRGNIDMSTLFYSINFNAGYYKPGMNYWNEESFIADLGKSFNGGLMFQGGIDLKIYDGFIVGLTAGTFSDKVEVFSRIGLIERDEKLTYRLTPLSGILKYEFTLGSPRRRYRSGGLANLHPYVGGGVNYTFITQTLRRDFVETEREDQKESQNGSTVTYSAIAGVRYDLTAYVGLGTEFNYVIGSYDQNVSTEGVITTENISLTGPAISATLYIKVGQKTGYGNRRPRSRSRYRRR